MCVVGWISIGWEKFVLELDSETLQFKVVQWLFRKSVFCLNDIISLFPKVAEQSLMDLQHNGAIHHTFFQPLSATSLDTHLMKT